MTRGRPKAEEVVSKDELAQFTSFARSRSLPAALSLRAQRVATLTRTTLHSKPANGSTPWSVRTESAESGIAKSSVQRCSQLFGLQPQRTEGFKLSNDPFFAEKLRDVVGLYLSPPVSGNPSASFPRVPCLSTIFGSKSAQGGERGRSRDQEASFERAGQARGAAAL